MNFLRPKQNYRTAYRQEYNKQKKKNENVKSPGKGKKKFFPASFTETASGPTETSARFEPRLFIILPRPIINLGWNCSSCTYVNHSDNSTCEVCNAPRQVPRKYSYQKFSQILLGIQRRR